MTESDKKHLPSKLFERCPADIGAWLDSENTCCSLFWCEQVGSDCCDPVASRKSIAQSGSR